MHDRASLPLIEHALTGSEVGTARIAFARVSDGKPADYLIIELLETRVSSVAMSSDGDRPVEQVTFLSPQMRWTHQPPGEDATSFGFDLGNQKSL
jgi:type VI protein secretion system component Hcp